MKIGYIEQSENLGNPLADQGIKMFMGQQEVDSEEALSLKSNEDYIFSPVFCFSHSGRIFKGSPFNDAWDSGLAGVMFIPVESFSTDFFPAEPSVLLEYVNSLLDEYTNWAEGYVYDIHILDVEAEDTDLFDPESFDIHELMLEPLCLESMFEDRSTVLMDFMKENDITIKYVESQSNLSSVFEDFKKLYLGKNVFGLIPNTESLFETHFINGSQATEDIIKQVYSNITSGYSPEKGI